MQDGRAYYEEALKKGRKEYKSLVAKGEFPYLPVLDEILKTADIRTEQNMGLVSIPLEFVIGTSTMGRTQCFTTDFLPIMEMGSEFSSKWRFLAQAQIEEGIRDPIKVYEYMNRYYVVEGNKRASVLKYFGASEVSAYVTRKIPYYKEDDMAIKLYYELMHFIDVTGIFNMEFTKPGMADQILEQTGYGKRWGALEREEFNKVTFMFTKAFEYRGGRKLPITVGDALSVFINLLGYDKVVKMNSHEYTYNVVKAWNEFLVLTEHHMVDLVLDPSSEVEEKKTTSLLEMILPSTKKKLKVAFLYPKDPEQSDWLYAHELGRLGLDQDFADELETVARSNVNEQNAEAIMEELIADGFGVIFCVAPQLMKACLNVAMEHPHVKILNCSLNTPHQLIRTYYSRMYEAKFISGLVAGAMTENDRVGYIADYPLFGMVANINAFALGVACTNPRAKVYLDWSTRKDFDKEAFLRNHDLEIVSDQDMITPKDYDRRYGLYRYKDGVPHVLALPLWNWGVFYERLMRGILAGVYQEEGENINSALNYWWGMSSGVIDVMFSNDVPVRVQLLAEHLKEDIIKGDLKPFFGSIYDQQGNLVNGDHQEMNPRQIMKMNYLVDNVLGGIPSKEEVVDTAKTVIEVKGV